MVPPFKTKYIYTIDNSALDAQGESLFCKP